MNSQKLSESTEAHSQANNEGWASFLWKVKHERTLERSRPQCCQHCRCSGANKQFSFFKLWRGRFKTVEWADNV